MSPVTATPALLRPDHYQVAWRDSPFSGKVHKQVLPQGLTCAEIVARVPDLDTRRFLEEGTLCINGEAVPRGMWHCVRPKSREDIYVTLHMPIRGGGGGGGKDVLRIVAAIALVAVASFVSGGAAAALLGPAFGAGTFGAAVLAGAITLGGALLLGAFVRPPSAAIESDESRDERGQRAALQGNVLRRGEPVPRVVGTHRVFPPFLAQPLIDLQGYDEVIEATYGLAGPHRIRDVRFGDILADNIDPEQLQYQFYELIPGEGGVDDNVQLMLHFNGEQDSTAIEDSSSASRSITLNGNPFLDKGARWLGRTACYFGGSDWLSISAASSTVLGGSDFSIDFWEQVDGPLSALERHLCGQTNTNLDANDSSFFIAKNADGTVSATVYDGTSGITLTSTASIESGRHHIALARIGTKLYLWIDGIIQAVENFTGIVPSSSGTFDIATRGNSVSALAWVGWIDEFRLSIGESKYEAENFKPSEVQYKPAEPDLVTRYGKTAQPNIILSKHRIDNEGADQTTRDLLSNQQAPQRSIPQSQSVAARGRGLDEVWVTLTFPGGIFYQDDEFEQSWFFAIPLRIRVRPLGGDEDEWVKLPEVHVHDRRTSSFSRMLVFRWDTDATLPGGTPNTQPPAQKGWVAAYSTVPVQDQAPLGIGGWEADDHFYAGSGDTYMTTDNLSTTGLRNVRLTTERAEFFLDDLVEKGPLEIEIRRGQLYNANDFTYSTYSLDTDPPDDALGNGVFDFFGWATLGTEQVTLLKEANGSDRIDISRVASVWNSPPIARKGVFSTIYVKAKARNLDALSVIASGLVPDWDGEAWTGLHATSNPAPHYRDVLTGSLNDNRIPESLVNDDVLLEWRQRCADLEFKCNAVFAGDNVDRVLEVIASCGYAKPRQSDLWDVAQDRDFSSVTPVQMFNPRNMRAFRWEKAFVRHRPDGLRVKFNDENDLYVERTLVVPRFGVLSAEAGRLEEIRYDGLTSVADVVVRALYDQQQVIDRFTFYYGEVDAEMLVCRRGDLVLVQHDTLDKVAGFSRVRSVDRENGAVTGITLDGSVSPVDAFFTTPTDFFEEPSDFFSDNVGVGIRLKDGTFTAFDAEVQEDGFVLAPSQPLVGLSEEQLERECLVSTGRLLRSSRRMLVFDIKPRTDLTAGIAFVDESPELWQFPEPLAVEEGYMRNRLINGDMRLDQRGRGETHVLSDGAFTYTLDRWRAFSDGPAFDVQQLADDPPAGFTHYLRATVTNPESPVADGNLHTIGQAVLGADMQGFDWGRASGRTLALSFMVRSSVAGTFGGAVYNSVDSLSYPFTFSVPVADQWVRRVITIPPPPTLSPSWSVDDDSTSLAFDVVLGAGDNFRSNQANTWVSGSSIRAADIIDDLVSTLGATLDITGVQLEIAPATQFEYLPLGIQQERAYRYTQSFRSPTSADANIGTGVALTTTTAHIVVPLPVPLRTVPLQSISFFSASSFALLIDGPNSVPLTDLAVLNPDESNYSSVALLATVASGLTAGEAVVLQAIASPSPDDALILDAELY